MTDWYSYTKHKVSDQEGIDQWLDEYIGKGNWSEWLPLTPYLQTDTRTFSFKYSKHTTMFLLKWT
jgi:hypothetical protein